MARTLAVFAARSLFVGALAGCICFLLQGSLHPLSATAASRPAGIARSSQATVLQTEGDTVTQTFSLQAGWNAVYLEIEPHNPSAVINVGTVQDPLWAPEKSVLDAYFGALPGLESIWHWNQPLTRMDYIIEPSEGLWDEPGWKRYFPAGQTGVDGLSQAFLTTLLNLHANQGYLIKMADDLANPVQVQIAGRPTVRKHAWAVDAFNLAGFPIAPGAAPRVSDFFAPSSLQDIYALSPGGQWQALSGSDTLAQGAAYLLYVAGQANQAVSDYTAPLVIEEVLVDGLEFAAGVGGRTARLRLANLSATPISVTLSLAGSGVALRVTDPVNQVLTAGDATLSVDGGSVQVVHLAVRSTEQPQAGAALLQITSADLGVRWRIPVRARSGSHAGLWVGEVTVNDVSEGRLGQTNVADGSLTVGLAARSERGIRGAITLQAGGSGLLNVTLNLDLPAQTSVNALDQSHILGDPAAVGGYVFVDANQNGQRDGDEPGLPGVTVRVGGRTLTSAADGAYVAANLSAGTRNTSISLPAGLADYSSDFPVVLPGQTAARANALPASVTVDDQGVTDISPAVYRTQTLPPPHTLPVYDTDDNRVQPQVNFGHVLVYRAELWQIGAQGCPDPVARAQDLGRVVNGHLEGQISQELSALLGGSYAVRVLDARGVDVACGEIREAAPVRDPFTYRILLRVAADDTAELLPYYELITGTRRISSPIFSFQGPIAAGNGSFSGGSVLDFPLSVDANDPRNPFKHKYHPDHDNLDASFTPLEPTLPPHLWEAPAFGRRVQFGLVERLQDLPGMDAAEPERLEAQVDWGGVTWGGTFKEVVQGIHKNDITVRGYFVIRQILTADQLREQPYD